MVICVWRKLALTYVHEPMSIVKSETQGQASKCVILMLVFFPSCWRHFSLQEERRILAPRAPPSAAQETPFGIYGPPAAYTSGYF